MDENDTNSQHELISKENILNRTQKDDVDCSKPVNNDIKLETEEQNSSDYQRQIPSKNRKKSAQDEKQTKDVKISSAISEKSTDEHAEKEIKTDQISKKRSINNMVENPKTETENASVETKSIHKSKEIDINPDPTFDDDESTCSEWDYVIAIEGKKASTDPNFAVIWSFCHVFGDFIGLPRFSLDDLEAALSSTSPLATTRSQEGLLELIHIKLLRKLAKSCKSQFSTLARVSVETLPKFLPKVCDLLELSFAWDITTFGYHVLSIADKLKLLKNLCDLQFDENPKLRAFVTDQFIKTDNATALRYQPIGSDVEGRMAWLQEDLIHNNLRLYMVEDDDDDGTTWKLVASNSVELEVLIERLKKKCEINPKDKALQLRNERKEKARKEREERQLKISKAKKKKRNKKQSISDHSDDEDENPCARCFSNRNPEEVLLCDGCDAAYHTLCLRPPLLIIPENDWYCPYCQQVSLCDRLEIKLKETTTRMKTKERKSKRMDFYGIKLSNIVDDSTGGDIGFEGSRRSGRSKKDIDYNFSDFDRIINEATGTKKAASHIASQPAIGTRRSNRRLNDLDADSDASSGNEYIDESSDFKRIARLSKFKYNGRKQSLRRGLRNAIESDEEDNELPARRTKRRCLAKNSLLLQSSLYDEEADTKTHSGKNEDEDNYNSKSDIEKSLDDDSDIASGSFSDDSLVHEKLQSKHQRQKKKRVISESDENESIISDIVNDDVVSSDNADVDTDDLCESDNENDNKDDEEEISEEEIEIPMPAVKQSTGKQMYDSDTEVVSNKETSTSSNINQQGKENDLVNKNHNNDIKPIQKIKNEQHNASTNEETIVSEKSGNDNKTTSIFGTQQRSNSQDTIKTSQNQDEINSTLMRQNTNSDNKSTMRNLENQQRRSSQDKMNMPRQMSSSQKQNGAVELFQPYRQHPAVTQTGQMDHQLPHTKHSTLPQIPPLKKPSLNFGVDQLTSPSNLDTRNFSPSTVPYPHNFSHPMSPNHYTSPSHNYPHFDPLQNVPMHIPTGNQLNEFYSRGSPMQHSYSPSLNVPQLNKMPHNTMRNSPYTSPEMYSPMMNTDPFNNQPFMRWPSGPQVHYPQQQSSPTFQPSVDPLRNFPYPPTNRQQPPT